jgi:hypothetical protein
MERRSLPFMQRSNALTRVQRHRAATRAAPELGSQAHVRKWELHDAAETPQECRGEGIFRVCREDREAVVALHALEEISNLDVCPAISATLELRALAEQCVGLIEEQDGATCLCRVEDAAQPLLGLAAVLVDDLAEIDVVEVERYLAR